MNFITYHISLLFMLVTLHKVIPSIFLFFDFLTLHLTSNILLPLAVFNYQLPYFIVTVPLKLVVLYYLPKFLLVYGYHFPLYSYNWQYFVYSISLHLTSHFMLAHAIGSSHWPWFPATCHISVESEPLKKFSFYYFEQILVVHV